MQMISDLSVKMEIKKDKIILFLIFLLAFGFRLIFLFRIPFFSSDETYFHLRHSKYILENFLPLIYDTQPGLCVEYFYSTASSWALFFLRNQRQTKMVSLLFYYSYSP